MLCGITLFGFAILRILPHFLRKIFEVFMFLWMGIGFIGLLLCIITEPVDILLKYMDINRIYLWYFLITSTVVISLYSIFNALRDPTIFRITLPVKKDFPKEIEKLRLAVISDVHVSGLIGKKRVEKITNMVNNLAPDIICITGDLMDGGVHQLHTQIEPFKNLKAKRMIVYITGNHEFYSGPHHWKEFFKDEFQWKVLSNSSQIIPFENYFINILGIEDRHWLKYKQIPKNEDNRLEKSVAHLHDHQKDHEQKFSYNILLAHQPKDWKHFILFPWIDLQISGHTHGGGQLWPLQYIVKRDQKYYAGLYHLPETNQHVYVNRGTGFWGPPMRLGTTSEITLMTFACE